MRTGEAYIIVRGHAPVLLDEVIAHLITDTAGHYVDATFGCGGHSRAILEQLDSQGKLTSIDCDMDACHRAVDINDSRFCIHHGNFANIKSLISGSTQGILMDLGVCSTQIDNADRGLSFMQDGPLDMRLDRSCGESAADWLNSAQEKDIAWVLYRFGEEKFSRSIAAAIMQNRPITTTGQLVKLIISGQKMPTRNKHPATRSFQAIRIFINRELENLETALLAASSILPQHGRLAVISFHSLEDRMVKNIFRKVEMAQSVHKTIPIMPTPYFKIWRKVLPSQAEIQRNTRSRSAVLRVLERIHS